MYIVYVPECKNICFQTVDRYWMKQLVDWCGLINKVIIWQRYFARSDWFIERSGFPVLPADVTDHCNDLRTVSKRMQRRYSDLTMADVCRLEVTLFVCLFIYLFICLPQDNFTKRTEVITNFMVTRRPKTKPWGFCFNVSIYPCPAHTLLILIILICVLFFILFSIFRACLDQCFVLWRHTQFLFNGFISVFLLLCWCLLFSNCARIMGGSS